MEIPPILIVAFNRPLHTLRIFNEVKKAEPSKLYIAIDGPRKNHKDDTSNIGKTIEVFNNVDWKCEVNKLIRTDNLGCKDAVSSAITWFFENEEHGIILEDDCLPSLSFFNYCHYLLLKYKDEESVMHINGVNFQNGHARGTSSYYFSKVCHVWGWASWRRAWKKYDMEMSDLDGFFDSNLYKSVINYPTAFKYWSNAFYKTKMGLIDTWDYQWVYSIWKNNGLVIAPNFNLISNIGFDELATHTKFKNNTSANRPIVELDSEITDCNILVPFYEADRYSFMNLFSLKKRNIVSRIKSKLIKVFVRKLK